MSLHSKFRGWAFILVALVLLLTGLVVFSAAMLLDSHSLPSFWIIVFLLLSLFLWTWLVFGELRTKVITVQIEDKEIIISNYLGLGRKRTYSFSDFDSLQTAILPSEYDAYEYLYLISEGKKVVKISQFYHSNYDDLKKAMAGKIRNGGQQKFSFLQELKEIFI